ncbi:NADH-quinone oxidoreductase subunit NuoF [Candidatus Nitrospira salsa]
MQARPLTQHIDLNRNPLSLTEYTRKGGYESVHKTIQEMTPHDVQQLVTDSNLRGRGGAGFPTGKKWGFVPMGNDAPSPKYLVANADEMEPGSFKDRLLLEGHPHLVIEGMIVSAYAIQAQVGYIFLRWAYHLAATRLQQAIDEAKEQGYLGQNILNSDFSFEVHVHTSAGRYICGEETALLNALEGKPVIPRDKPPYPQACGLWGKPTIVQNVETLSNVPHIITRGAEEYQRLGFANDGGTKLYGVSGKVRRPGVWELPIGTPLREILEEHAGGMQDGFRFRGVLPGGASTAFLVEQHLDLEMDFESVPQAGSRLGTGTMIILDDRTCPVAFIHNLEHFFAQESCGWCTPCREGLPWTERLLSDLELGRGTVADLETLHQHTRFLGPGHTFCAHAPGAMEPLKSGLKYFKEDFDQHIREQHCPYVT